jgi:hypothetical protein
MTALIIIAIAITILFSTVSAIQNVQASRMVAALDAANVATVALLASSDVRIARTNEMLGA